MSKVSCNTWSISTPLLACEDEPQDPTLAPASGQSESAEQPGSGRLCPGGSTSVAVPFAVHGGLCQGPHRDAEGLVQAWPFPCLPLGDLAESPDLEILKAVLDGLDLLLAKKEHPNRWKLQVLNLRKEHPNIWIQGYPSMAQISYPDVLTDRPTESCGKMTTVEQPLILLMDLTSKMVPRMLSKAHLLQWVRERQEQVQLCSRKLRILSGSIYKIQKALRVVRLDSIQELVLQEWLVFLQIWGTAGQLQHLQELYVHDVCFHYEKPPSILRTLTSLKTLSLSSCLLSEAHLRFLFQCPCTKQLKHLRLRSLSTVCFSLETLLDLLQGVAGTLETLALEDLAFTDVQLSALLPALSQCSQLRFFSFYGNHISMAALQILLSHTAQMGHLRRGLYPAPLESYYPQNQWPWDIHRERFAQVLAVLAQTLMDMRPSHKVQICTKFSHYLNKYRFYTLESNGSWLLTEEHLSGLSTLSL
ncbi:PRAME family member 12-like [Dipodomys merriami]|uniref:PRAME family member 12-like n=1 Tax=Dipodomys merriami TaxID=94247 RepID=UPI00385569BC